MGKKFRRVYDKYEPGRHSAGAVIKNTCTYLGSVVKWFEDHLGEHELIDIHEWHDELFYIVVADTRIQEYHLGQRIGLTIDVKRDRIHWSDMRCEPSRSGGNCFVQSAKWKGLANKHWIGAVKDGRFHNYRDFKRGE